MYFCKELNVHIYIYTCVHDGVFVSSGDFFWIFYVGWCRVLPGSIRIATTIIPEKQALISNYDTFSTATSPWFWGFFGELLGRYTTPYPARNHFPHVTGSLILFSASYKIGSKTHFSAGTNILAHFQWKDLPCWTIGTSQNHNNYLHLLLKHHIQTFKHKQLSITFATQNHPPIVSTTLPKFNIAPE